jgi:hypothetical protein
MEFIELLKNELAEARAEYANPAEVARIKAMLEAERAEGC